MLPVEFSSCLGQWDADITLKGAYYLISCGGVSAKTFRQWTYL